MDVSREFALLLFDTPFGKKKNEMMCFMILHEVLVQKFLRTNSCNRVPRLKVAGAGEKVDLI